MTPADLDATARTVWAEARGEGYMGMRGVAHVIINRWHKRHRREHTLCGVATEPWQFSAWNPDDVNRELLEGVNLNNQHFRMAVRAVLESYDAFRDGNDPTHGATHYHTEDKPVWATTWPPNWAQGKEPVERLGAHLFYSDVD